MFRVIARWACLIFTLMLPLFVFFLMDTPPIDTTNLDLRLSAMSWLVTGVVGFLALIVLYLTIILENRVFKVIRGVQDYLQPFGISFVEMQKNIQQFFSKTKAVDLILLFYTYLIAVTSLNVLWVVIIKRYAPVKKSHILNFNNWDFSLSSVSVSTLYFLAISFWLFSVLVGIMLILIINEKNIIGKYRMPKGLEIFDVKYLRAVEASLSEIISKSEPALSFYQHDKVELYLNANLPLFNLTYHFKFYSSNGDIKINIYHKVAEDMVFPLSKKMELKEFICKIEDSNLTDDCILSIFNGNLIRELVTYDNNGIIISKHIFNVNNDSLEIKKIIPIPKVNLEKEKIKVLKPGTTVELESR